MTHPDSDENVPLVRLENSACTVDFAPALGGRIVSFSLLPQREELLWRNPAVPLARCAPGTAYDPWFYGGIDELLPCDLPETIDGVACPDHGELWTAPLEARKQGNVLRLWGRLPLFGLEYERVVELDPRRPILECRYRILNSSDQPRHFLWKLHAALAVEPGDVVECPAGTARPVDPAYTCCPSLEAFAWPICRGKDKSVIPGPDGTCEFLYLFDLAEGRMALRKRSGASFTYHFDREVFPCVWLFQSFGGFDGHYTTVLEPCTNHPIAVNDAMRGGRCALLAPKEVLVTTVRMVATPSRQGREVNS